MSRALVLLPLLGLACSTEPKSPGTGDSGESTPPPVFCDGTTAHRWDITDTTDADLFPDGLLERPDSSSPTGRTIEISEATASWLPSTPSLLLDALFSLNDSSGFGTLGGILLRFEGGTVSDVPLTAEASITDPGWQLLDLGSETPERVPFEARVQEDGLTVVLWPLRPLRLGTPHAFVLTTEATADDGGCVAPTETTQALLYGDELPDHPHAAESSERYRAALEQAGLRPDDVSILTVFTTHDETHTFRELAEVAKGESVEWGDFDGCEMRSELRQCTVHTTVLDRRNELGLIDPTVTPQELSIPVTVWLPGEGEGPWPVVVYGHGLGSQRTEGFIAARFMAEEGVAVVAMEAVAHGDHPTAEDDDSYSAALGFLGLDLTTLSINPQLLRGNFDQTNLDRVRLLKLIREHGDIDGDGIAELDGGKVGYLGVSLGAILGAQMLAVSPEVDGAVFSVGGGRLMSIVTETESLTDFEDLIAALIGSKERFDRLIPMAQHVVDPADSGLWGAHVLRDRFDNAQAPSLLLQIALDDEVVPKASGAALARAMGLAHLQPVAEAVELLEPVEGPLSGNGEDGASTHAFFQFDRVTRSGEVGPAYHIDTPMSEEAQYQMRVFLTAWLDGETPVAVDPYADLGTPEL